MKIYLDTGNINEIKDAAETGLIDGVTTNPTLIAKEGRDFKTVLKEIIKILNLTNNNYTISAEVTDLKNHNSMIKQARELAKLDKHILVKIPLTKEGLKAVKILAEEEIRCNVTLCFSANQALLAAKAGAWCVSPFIGRLDDTGENGLNLIREIKEIYDNYKIETRILAASIRSPEHVLNCARIGAEIATIPYKTFEQLYNHPLTDVGLKKFNDDWNSYIKSQKKK